MMLSQFTLGRTLRRGGGRTGEIYFGAEILDKVNLCPGLSDAMWEGSHLPFVILASLIGSALYDLWEMVTQPDIEGALTAPCGTPGEQLDLDIE